MAHSPQGCHSVSQGPRRGKGHPEQARFSQGSEPGMVQYLDPFCVLFIKGANVKSISCIHFPTWGDQWGWVLRRARVGHQLG